MTRTKPLKRIFSPPLPESDAFFYVLYVILAFLAFSPCLLMGQAYFDNDLLAQFGPWRTFLKNQLSAGHFPLWNPYNLGGQPFFADLQNMMLYPVNWLTLLFSVPFGLSLFFFIHAALSAVGMHLWLRSLDLSRISACTGSLLFAFSGFFWLEIIHPPVLAAYAWLPWLFWTVERLVKNPRVWNAFNAGLVFAMLFLCGSFQVTVGALYGGLAYFVVRNWKSIRSLIFRPRLEVPKGKNLSFLFLFFVFLWGALPLLGQFIPTLEFSALCDRRAPGQTYDQLNSHWGLHPLTLYQFLFPRFILPSGQSMAEAIQYRNGPGNLMTNFLSTTGYLGVWIPFLVLWAFRREKKGLLFFFLFLCLGALALCSGNYLPVHRILYETLPGFSLIRISYRFIYLYVLGMSALAAFGFEEWRGSFNKGKSLLARLKVPLIYVFILYLAALFRPSQNWRELAALVVGLCAIFLYASTARRNRWGVPLFQAALILPLFLNGLADFIPGPASNYNFIKNSKTLNDVARRVQPYRLIFANSHMFYPIQVENRKYILNYPQNASCTLGIKNFGGYNPLTLNTKTDLGAFSMRSLIQIGAIGGLVTGENFGEIPDFKLAFMPPYYFYQYQKPLFYVFAPFDIQVIPDPNKRLERLKSPDFNAYREVILSEVPSRQFAYLLAKTPARLWYRIERDDPDQQRFTIGLDQNSFVVFSEVMFPGWKAFIDGKPADLMTSDHLLRTLFIPAGQHVVEFCFKPDWVLPLQIGLLVWVLTTLGWFIGAGMFKNWTS